MRTYLTIIFGYSEDCYNLIIDGSLAKLLKDEVVMVEYGNRGVFKEESIDWLYFLLNVF
jgi:hypothetical protein